MAAALRRSTPPLDAPDLDTAHDPGFVAASHRAEVAVGLGDNRSPLVVSGNGEIRIGTASWTDPTMVRGNVFYPRGTSSAEARLQYYASQFPVVEVDSTYYSLPDAANSARWAERTPAEFTFHVKAHALMTGQPTETSRLPPDLVRELPSAAAKRAKIYAKDVPGELLAAVWDHFIAQLTPLSDAGKLGGILLQYPRWFMPSSESRNALEEAATRLAGIPATVELRNHRWFEGVDATRRTLDLLRGLGLTHVMVDGPQGLESSVPIVPAVTNPALAMVRLHGRRAATWELAKVPTVERYRYLYSLQQLETWIPLIESAAAEATRTIVFFNNCYGNYGATNAREMIKLLQ